MNSEIKAKWLTALRSGEYGQGQGTLRANNEFCCLGVLCDIAVKQGLGEWESSEYSTSQTFIWTAPSDRYADRSEIAVLPNVVADWAELDTIDGELDFMVKADNGNRPQTTLASLNDSGMSFSEIADIIENQL